MTSPVVRNAVTLVLTILDTSNIISLVLEVKITCDLFFGNTPPLTKSFYEELVVVFV